MFTPKLRSKMGKYRKIDRAVRLDFPPLNFRYKIAKISMEERKIDRNPKDIDLKHLSYTIHLRSHEEGGKEKNGMGDFGALNEREAPDPVSTPIICYSITSPCCTPTQGKRGTMGVIRFYLLGSERCPPSACAGPFTMPVQV